MQKAAWLGANHVVPSISRVFKGQGRSFTPCCTPPLWHVPGYQRILEKRSIDLELPTYQTQPFVVHMLRLREWRARLLEEVEGQVQKVLKLHGGPGLQPHGGCTCLLRLWVRRIAVHDLPAPHPMVSEFRVA